MTDLRRMAAGAICTGFEGTHLNAQLAQLMAETPPAGLILFGRNVESLAQVRALTDTIRENLAAPIIAIDQEGGRVARIRDGVEQLPPMMAFGAARDLQLTGQAGEQTAFDLRRAGVNLDFAPVADLALDRMNTVIGTRAFGDDPQHVAELTAAFARGLQRGGVAATVKHFPGHGSTAVDSHIDLPVIEAPEHLLRERDLVPFARTLPEVEAVMTAHVVARAFDPDRPATVSANVLTDLLRGELHFDGVCFTDCLQMDAIARGIGSERAAVAALAAGADCLLVSHDFELFSRAVDAIVDAVQSGALARERLAEAHMRVDRLRQRLHGPLAIDSDAPYAGIGRQAALAAITLLRGESHVNARECAIISFQGATTEGVQGRHDLHATLTGYARIEQITLPLEPSSDEVTQALRRLAGMRPIVLTRRAHLYRLQRAAVERILEQRGDAMLVSTREPFDAFDFPHVKHVLCTYGDDAPSIAALAAVLFEGEPARGVLPLHHERVAQR